MAHLPREVLTHTAATVRFETPPGHQLQIDFGTVRVPIADEQVKVHLFVATLGYSRRTYVAMFLHERQSAWLQGLEGAFRHFGGTPREVLIDNARALGELLAVPDRLIRASRTISGKVVTPPPQADPAAGELSDRPALRFRYGRLLMLPLPRLEGTGLALRRARRQA